jgi:hypothetical protein
VRGRCPLCDRAASCAHVCSCSASHGTFCATCIMHQLQANITLSRGMSRCRIAL